MDLKKNSKTQTMMLSMVVVVGFVMMEICHEKKIETIKTMLQQYNGIKEC